MKNKALAIFGIIAWVLSILVSAQNESGQDTFPAVIRLIGGLLFIIFVIMAIVRLRKTSIVVSLGLLICLILVGVSTIAYEILKPAYGSPIILTMTFARILSVIMYVWAIIRLFRTA